MSGWPDPGKPGVPMNPHKEGWHWLDAGGPVLCEWRAARGWMDETWWPHAADLVYLGPCLLPAEVAALVQEEIASRYHPEMGTEWREDGSLHQLVAAREAEAFKRGAEAMREKAGKVAQDLPNNLSTNGRTFSHGYANGAHDVARAIRALPVPEDKP